MPGPRAVFDVMQTGHGGVTPRPRLSEQTWLSLWLAVLGLLPLVFTRELPLQDMPNHWASLTILEHSSMYPEFVSTGVWKTNSLFFVVLRLLHAGLGWSWLSASKAFVAWIIVQNAFTLPRALLAFGGKGALRASGWFLLPLVHNWWILMGMVDFAVSIPLALECMMLLHGQLAKPSLRQGFGVVVLSLLGWYAHVFSTLILLGLWALEVLRVTRRVGLHARMTKNLLRASLALVPACTLASHSVGAHFFEASSGIPVHFTPFLPPWENLYNCWAECAAGLTSKSAMSFATLLPASIGLWHWRKRTPWFSGLTLGLLALGTLFGPYIVTAWFYVNSRLAPFLWVAILARAQPVAQPHARRALRAVGLASSLAFALSLAWDYRLLGQDQARAREALAFVPEGANLLPLVLDAKGHGEHTRPLLQIWGQYVVAKHVSAPLLFAHSRSFPVMRRHPPEVGQSHLEIEDESRRLAATHCNPTDVACMHTRSAMWSHFWNTTAAPFDYVLTIGRLPADIDVGPFQLAYQGELVTFLRRRIPAKL